MLLILGSLATHFLICTLDRHAYNMHQYSLIDFGKAQVSLFVREKILENEEFKNVCPRSGHQNTR